MGVFDSLRSLAGAAVTRVTIRANILPFPIVLDAPLADDGMPAQPSQLGALVRPSFDFETPFGTSHVAPYGEPGDGAGAVVLGAVVLGAVAVLGLAGFGLFTLIKGK